MNEWFCIDAYTPRFKLWTNVLFLFRPAASTLEVQSYSSTHKAATADKEKKENENDTTALHLNAYAFLCISPMFTKIQARIKWGKEEKFRTTHVLKWLKKRRKL